MDVEEENNNYSLPLRWVAAALILAKGHTPFLELSHWGPKAASV